MQIHRYILRSADALLNFFVILFLCIVGLYAAYALWDNNQIYTAAENVQEDMLRLKPVLEDENGTVSFEELLAVNPDVCAWITLDNTEIDYPILQGANNLTYINTNVYGEFALAGSIFLDSRCDREFRNPYSLVYGHHMADSKMFGDLELYKEQKFFEKNKTGILILPDRNYNLEIFACLLVSASDDAIFDPDQWQSDISGLTEYVRQNALHIHQGIMDEISSNTQILALSTCSSEFTDARTIVLAVMQPYGISE